MRKLDGGQIDDPGVPMSAVVAADDTPPAASYALVTIAIGMPITGHPLAQNRTCGIPTSRLPPRKFDGEALVWPRMRDAWLWRPLV
jgi:hypothetical protein